MVVVLSSHVIMEFSIEMSAVMGVQCGQEGAEHTALGHSGVAHFIIIISN